MVINVTTQDFGGKLRNGDIIGVCNIIEYMRNVENNSNIRMFLGDDCIQQEGFGIQFRDFLKSHSDYFSETPGTDYFNFDGLNLWNFRSITKDVVKIDNSSYDKRDKVCIFPIFDAPYNIYRNWDLQLANGIINKFSVDYPTYDIIVCIAENLSGWYSNLNLGRATLSFNFDENLYHILTTKIFVGGATGTSLLASCLTNQADNYFYYSAQDIFHTFPFNINKQNMIMYSNYGCKV
jgi:hypothetical protein